MFEFTDRVPASGKANRKKLIHADGSVEYVTIENADDANPVGTPLNKATFEAMQAAIMPVVGTYTGNGEAERFIDLGFTPAAVLVLHNGIELQNINYGSQRGGLAILGNSENLDSSKLIKITNNGFIVYQYDADGDRTDSGDILLNTTSFNYAFIAFKGTVIN